MDYNIDSNRHSSGESLYIDDIVVADSTYYGWVYSIPCAHARIKTILIHEALSQPGVKAILSYKDIPGENQIGGIVFDEPLLAEETVHFFGQPLLLIIATKLRLAKEASRFIKVEYESLPVITDPRIAVEKNELLIPPMIFASGDCERGFAESDVIVSGRADSGGQEHLYLEPQGAIAIPLEGGQIKIISSTQGPTAVQRVCAKVLGLPMHAIEVEVRRLGGGFGGKEDQATPWACLAALACAKLKNPIKLVLPRFEDMCMTGKRHPYSSDFKLGLKKDGTFHAFEVSFYQNGGAATDLSPAVLSRTLFHGANAYFIPHTKFVGYSARTNLPPNTAFRGFGGPQGMFVMEAAIALSAEKLGISAATLQRKNLLRDGQMFHYGQKVKNCQARRSWEQLEKKYDCKKIEQEIAMHNKKHTLSKKGYAYMPICFGISFTKTSMNQASSLVHIYHDGSVAISTAAVEMGQGVNSKICQVASEIFQIQPKRITIHSTNTSRIANTSPTAASSGADLNGKSTERACLLLKERLLDHAAKILNAQNREDISFLKEEVLLYGKKTELTWQKLIEQAFLNRINLSSHAHYATPDIYFDLNTNKGEPFAYHVYGTALIVVSVDTLRGLAEVDKVYVVHDYGQSMNYTVDLGQLEGGLVQGIGWMSTEDLRFDDNTGRLLSSTLSTYKVCDLHGAPKEILSNQLEGSTNPMGIFNSKAIGEPPLMYGIGFYFAVRNAIKAFRGYIDDISICAPYTAEKILSDLYKPLKSQIYART